MNVATRGRAVARRLLTKARRRPVALGTGLAVLAAGTVPILASIVTNDRAVIAATVRASVTTSEGQASGSQPAISADGRYVAFVSKASSLGSSTYSQVYLRDLVDTTTRLVSASTTGGAANNDSSSPVVSADGRYVAFASWASNLVGADGNGKQDVFVRDMAANSTALVSVATGGAQANDNSNSPSISASGGRVAFVSNATNLDPVDDLNGQHNPNVL
ncbi:MAG: TolB family protein, partial [Acidimicrobiales bacterium]